MKKIDAPIIVEGVFDTAIEAVWKSITELNQMQQWFFKEIVAFEPVVGFKTSFDIQLEDKNFLHLWTILESEPNKKITYDWRYENHPGVGKVIFELFEENNQTRLKLTNIVVEDFPQDIPEFKTESCRGGWEYFINQSLKNYLSKI